MKSLNKLTPEYLAEVIPMSIKMTRSQHLFLRKAARNRGLRMRDLLIKAVKQYVRLDKEQ